MHTVPAEKAAEVNSETGEETGEDCYPPTGPREVCSDGILHLEQGDVAKDQSRPGVRSDEQHVKPKWGPMGSADSCQVDKVCDDVRRVRKKQEPQRGEANTPGGLLRVAEKDAKGDRKSGEDQVRAEKDN